MLELLACQIAIPEMATPAERDRHLVRTVAEVSRRLEQRGADLVVLPELSSVAYSRQVFDRLDGFAEALDGPSFQAWRQVAQRFETVVVFGIPRRGADGFHIAQLAVGPDGHLIGHFDKLHIAQFGGSMEKEYFARGGHLFCFEIKGVRISPIICYDIRVPELARALVLEQGVQLLLHCGAYCRDESFYSWHDFVVTRAMENQAFVLSLNRAGADFGRSLFCQPWVDGDQPPHAFPDRAEAFERLTVDPAKTVSTRKRYSFLADKLPDYGALVCREPAAEAVSEIRTVSRKIS
ncbi:MAG: carbon-nitrogen hydrolase family protein [Pseudomonadota bacterium]